MVRSPLPNEDAASLDRPPGPCFETWPRWAIVYLQRSKRRTLGNGRGEVMHEKDETEDGRLRMRRVRIDKT